MYNNSLISIIIPVYNVEKYLKGCLDSVVSQTYKNLEIILVDDGSTDRSGKICDEFARQDNRIRVIHKQNGGLSSARNAGLDVMQGEYLAFVDSDDMIDETYIETLYDMIKKYNTKISMISFEFFTQIEEIQAIKQKNLNNKTINSFSVEEFFKNYFIFKPKFNNFIWRCLYHRDIFDNVIFPNGILFEDVFIYSDIYTKIGYMIISDKILYFYRIRVGSITKSFSYKHLDIINVYNNMTSNIVKKFPNLVKQANFKLCCTYLGMAKMIARNGNLRYYHYICEYYKFIHNNLDILYALKTNLKNGSQLLLFYFNKTIFLKIYLLLKRDR